LLIGALLFVVFDLRQPDGAGPPDRIVIDAEEVKQLRSRFERARLRPPTAGELQGLIDDRVRDEIYYREALALGLDRDDPIVRRRMRMKLEFMLDDLSSVAADDEQLRAYLEQESERYRIEARVSFRQVFLSFDRHDDLDGAARQILRQLRQGADPNAVGDTSLLPSSMALADESLVERSFGADFGRALSNLEPGDWEGPIFSAYGAHLVRVDERIAAKLPSLDEVRDAVQRDYLAQRRDRQRNLAYRRLRDKYDVVIQMPSPQSDTAGASVPAAQAAEN
jgi:hypothetical protein